MQVTTENAFLVFRGWKEKGSVLRVTGSIGQSTRTGTKFTAKVLSVSEEAEEIRLLSNTIDGGHEEVRIELSGALFQHSNRQDDKEAFGMSVQQLLGGIVLLVEDFRSSAATA